MIVARLTPIDLFALLPELRPEMDPKPTQLDGLLEDDELFGRVKADLRQRWFDAGRGDPKLFGQLPGGETRPGLQPGGARHVFSRSQK